MRRASSTASVVIWLGFAGATLASAQPALDAGIGGVWERNPDRAVRSSGAITFGEKLTAKLTGTATLTQAFGGLWKTGDLSDALYTAGIGLATQISTRTQLKVEVLNTYKNRPPHASVKKNDVVVLMAIVYKTM